MIRLSPFLLLFLFLLNSCKEKKTKLSWNDFKAQQLEPYADSIKHITILPNQGEIETHDQTGQISVFVISDFKEYLIEDDIQRNYPSVHYEVQRRTDITGAITYWLLLLVVFFLLPAVTFLYTAFHTFTGNWKVVYLVIICILPVAGSLIFWITRRKYQIRA